MSDDLTAAIAGRLQGADDDDRSEGLRTFRAWWERDVDPDVRDRLEEMMRSSLRGRHRGLPGEHPDSIIGRADRMIAEHQHAGLTAVEGFAEWWALWTDLIQSFEAAHGPVNGLDWVPPADGDSPFGELLELVSEEYVPRPITRALEGDKPVDPRTERESNQ